MKRKGKQAKTPKIYNAPAAGCVGKPSCFTTKLWFGWISIWKGWALLSPIPPSTYSIICREQYLALQCISNGIEEIVPLLAGDISAQECAFCFVWHGTEEGNVKSCFLRQFFHGFIMRCKLSSLSFWSVECSADYWCPHAPEWLDDFILALEQYPLHKEVIHIVLWERGSSQKTT